MSVYRKYYLFSVIGILIASCYPIIMGISVVTDMLTEGFVLGENYPKYIIPYTPICLALIVGVSLMPLIIKYAKRFTLVAASIISVGIFFLSELLLEQKVIVSTTITTTLESWQMYMCYVPPEKFQTRTWTELDVLIGEYSPAFKVHFYIISVVLILSLLNCFYGFAQMLKTGNHSRMKALVIQSVSSVLFLGLCILACFTAFFRDGEITVSLLSAVLMSSFFVLLGVTTGIFAGSFLLNRKRWLSVIIPSVVSVLTTLVMYIGEMILLSGNLYRFGSGIFFDGLDAIVLAPVDVLVIALSGFICALLMILIHQKRTGR